MKLELELEQEGDGRWLAEFTRFPGVAAYGPSKEEAIRNAAKVLIESTPQEHKNVPSLRQSGPSVRAYAGIPTPCVDLSGMHRPVTNCEYGCTCSLHGYPDKAAMTDEGTSEQASPTPDKCPKCNSADRSGHIVAWAGLEAVYCQDSWHSSAATPKGTK